MKRNDFIANVRHIGWVAFQIAANQSYNEEINKDQYESLLDSIEFLDANSEVTPKQMHENWMNKKIEQGWKHGGVKDFNKKTHPDLIAYEELPDIEKRKDVMSLVMHKLAIDLWRRLEKS